MRIKAYLAVLATFIIVDGAWIALVVTDYYRQTLGPLMREAPMLWVAAVFYFAYAAGIVALAVSPARQSGSLGKAAVNGALLGVLAYGTYTVTNFAILSAWTPGLLVSDILWGGFLTAVCAAAGYLADRPRPG